jgi:hypothetical protein
MSLDAAQVVRGPYLQSAGSDRITLCWKTDVETTSEVAFGLAPESTAGSVAESGMRTDHAITLTGLPPATRHYYRIKGIPTTGASVDLGGANHWFETAPVDGTPKQTRIWVVGDSGYGYPQPLNSYNSYMSSTTAVGKKTDAFLMLGDNAYDIGTDNQYQQFVFNRYANLLRNAPVWSTFGNHDAYSSNQPGYLGPVPYDSIFRFPTSGECGGMPSGSERYFSFNHGNIHFISLDTWSYDIAGDLPGGPYGMVDWLLDDLKACTSDWIIAFMHLGAYTRGSKNSDTDSEWIRTRNYVIPLLESYGADLIISAHSHVYERSGLIDGHYGISSTFNPATMRKWPGNGSDIGGVDAAGTFITGPSSAGGAYQKPAASGRSGAVYPVVGASSSAQNWVGGSSALVNPTPHPVHVTSLRAIGSMLIEVDGHRLNGRYLGEFGALMDDFTILKGATYTLHPAAPTTEGSLSGVAFPVTRTGSTAFAEQVPVAVDLLAGDGVTPSQAIAQFAAGQSSTEVKFFPAGSDPETRFEARLLPTTRSVQPGAAPRAAYRIAGGPQTGSFGPPDPMNATTWYTSRFGAPPSSPAVWDLDDDGDGLSLLLEYALGGEPGTNNSALLPQGKFEGGSFIYRYIRPAGRSDLSYQILGSADLYSWPLPALSDVNDGPITALGEPRKVELPAGSPLKFVRMKVELQP